jgi:predicted O-methyltransferase YrrM
MNFTVDWFVNNIGVWESIVLPMVPRDAQILEIGSYEGKSTIWMAEHFPDAIIECVDTFKGGMEHENTEGLLNRFKENTKEFKLRIKTHIGYSNKEVRKFNEDRFDLIYIDGSHQSKDVLTDAVQAWYCLKVGGLMVFDDYGWDAYPQPELNPGLAIDCFLSAFIGHYEVMHKEYQVILKKI